MKGYADVAENDWLAFEMKAVSGLESWITIPV